MGAIELDVLTRLNDAAARTSSQRIEGYFEQADRMRSTSRPSRRFHSGVTT